MGHNPKIPADFRVMSLDDAWRVSQPVVIYCLNCTRARGYSSEKLRNLVQRDIPFGSLQGGFWCGHCRRSAIAVIFPCGVRSPIEWVQREREVRNDMADDLDDRAAGQVESPALPFTRFRV